MRACRRQIQLQSAGGVGPRAMAAQILRRDGVGGLYRGFLPNAIKNLPNKGTQCSIGCTHFIMCVCGRLLFAFCCQRVQSTACCVGCWCTAEVVYILQLSPEELGVARTLEQGCGWPSLMAQRSW